MSISIEKQMIPFHVAVAMYRDNGIRDFTNEYVGDIDDSYLGQPNSYIIEIPGARFQDCGVRDFRGRDLSNSNFSGCHMNLAKFQGTALACADFSGASLRHAEFEQCNLAGANFRGADLTGVSLAGSTLDDADFTGAIGIMPQEYEMSILRRIYEVAGKQDDNGIDLLEMGDWHSEYDSVYESIGGCEPSTDSQAEFLHTCGTCHCLAGWAQVFAVKDWGDQSQHLFQLSAKVVGSACIPSVAHLFYQTQWSAEQIQEEIKKFIDGDRPLVKRRSPISKAIELWWCTYPLSSKKFRLENQPHG